MRDNHEGYPELLDAYERDGLYFGAVRLIIAGEVAAFEFGLDKLSGWYEKPGGQLYVNRGIGTTGPPIRLGTRPEITVLELVRGL